MTKHRVISCKVCGRPWRTTVKTTERCRTCVQRAVAAVKSESQRSRILAMATNASRDRCVEWSGPKCKRGYARTHVAGRLVRLHRFVYDQLKGTIPPGLDVLHSCDNPPCINPHHLFVGTHTDNMIDMVLKGRHRGPIGETHPRAKLTIEQVRQIRDESGSHRKIGKTYGISGNAVGAIKNHKSWKHVV